MLLTAVLSLLAATAASAAAVAARTNSSDGTVSSNPSSEHNRICVKYSESAPDNIADTVQWLRDWISAGDANADGPGSRNGGFVPATLQAFFDIPKGAFNCPGPIELQGKAHACVVATDDYCFSGHGSLSDLQAAWEVLNLVARFRKARMIVEGMFVLSLLPPKGVDKYGKGLAVDFAGLVKDFYNGAYGDSSLQATPMLHAIAAIFLFTPYGLGKNKALWDDVSYSLAALDSPTGPLKCTYFDLMNSTDCITKPGFASLYAHWFETGADREKSRQYVDIIEEISTYTIPYKADGNLLSQQYASYRQYFLRTMFTRIQQAQGLFFHVQPYDLQPDPGKEDDYKPYWEVFCGAIVTSMAGSWCKDSKTGGTDSKAYYPVQIAADKNASVRFDYPGWNNLQDYGWDGHVIMGQSNRCADLKEQSFDMKNPYPDTFDLFSKFDDAVAWINAIDPGHIDYTECLWNIPILEFSDGPHYSGTDKAEDTLNSIGYIMSHAPLEFQSAREQWQKDAPRSEQMWNVVRQSNYCEYHQTVLAIGTINQALRDVAWTMKQVFGWGEVESDDQMVADVFGAQQMIPVGTPAADAMEKLHQAACMKLTEDALTVIMKELIDIMINIAAFELSGDVPVLSMVAGSAEAAMLQTLADNYFLQPWVDGVLRQEFTLDGDAATEIKEYLSPHFSTNKVGDGE